MGRTEVSQLGISPDGETKTDLNLRLPINWEAVRRSELHSLRESGVVPVVRAAIFLLRNHIPVTIENLVDQIEIRQMHRGQLKPPAWMDKAS